MTENMWQKINKTDIPPYLSWRGYNGVKDHEQTDIECPYPAWQLIIARDILKWAFMVADKQGRVKLTINNSTILDRLESLLFDAAKRKIDEQKLSEVSDASLFNELKKRKLI